MTEKNKQLAEQIADYLFTDGSGRKIHRLVIEYEAGEFPGRGGWGKSAVRDAIQRHLDGALPRQKERAQSSE